MNIVFKACMWALTILSIAIAARIGLIEQGAAATLIVILPLFAVRALRAGKACTMVKEG